MTILCAGDGERVHTRHLLTLAGDSSLPVQYSGNFRSQLHTADYMSHDWQMSCTDTAEVVHQLMPSPAVYAEYQADGLLPVDLLPVGRDSTTLCLEKRYHWTGFVHEPAHAQSTGSDKLPEVARACQPEVEMLVRAIYETNAAYLAVEGSTESVVSVLKCIPLEKLPVYAVSVDCHDVTSGTATRSMLGLNRAMSDRQRCEYEVTQRGWSLYAETSRDFVFVRPNGVI